jgi:hypothetical protein
MLLFLISLCNPIFLNRFFLVLHVPLPFQNLQQFYPFYLSFSSPFVIIFAFVRGFLVLPFCRDEYCIPTYRILSEMPKANAAVLTVHYHRKNSVGRCRKTKTTMALHIWGLKPLLLSLQTLSL